MNTRNKIIIVEIFLILILSNSGNAWTSTVGTNSSSWSISRQSGNISFELSGFVEGKISPVKYQDVVLGSYHSCYSEVRVNDVRLRERTSALEGAIYLDNQISLKSYTENDVKIEVTKPSGSNIFTIAHYEQWPVLMRANRNIEYSGRQINNRDFEGNNLNFAGSNLLFNRELSKQQRTIMWLDRMNATVLATDDNIIVAGFTPTMYLGYSTKIHSMGILDLKYKRTGPDAYPPRTTDYITLSEDNERYYGTYDLERKIEMRSVYRIYNTTEDSVVDWLP